MRASTRVDKHRTGIVITTSVLLRPLPIRLRRACLTPGNAQAPFSPSPTAVPLAARPPRIVWPPSCWSWSRWSRRQTAAAAGVLSLADFLPAGYVTDGSVCYQREIEQAVDTAAAQHRQLLVPPMTYRVDETGIQLHWASRMQMYGAVLVLDADRRSDGAVFVGHNVRDVTLAGGEIVGRNDRWPEGVNIRGVRITGTSARIRIQDIWMRDLSSNGIGVFGDESESVRDVTVQDVIVENCCNRYPEYLSQEKWEQGSTREDQGLIGNHFAEPAVTGESP